MKIFVRHLQPLRKKFKVAPATPGKQVKQLKTELEKKYAENTKLQSQLDELTKALDKNIRKVPTTPGKQVKKLKTV